MGYKRGMYPKRVKCGRKKHFIGTWPKIQSNANDPLDVDKGRHIGDNIMFPLLLMVVPVFYWKRIGAKIQSEQWKKTQRNQTLQ